MSAGGFYPTKELYFVTTAMTGSNSVAFEVYQYCMAWGSYMLAVILLKNSNTL